MGRHRRQGKRKRQGEKFTFDQLKKNTVKSGAFHTARASDGGIPPEPAASRAANLME
jgi:hypothetical protein